MSSRLDAPPNRLEMDHPAISCDPQTTSLAIRSGRGGTPSPRSLSPNSKHSATVIAWQRAIESLKNSVPEKDFQRLFLSTKPEDIVKNIVQWQEKQAKSKYCRVADGVRAGLFKLQRFDRAIDLIAQGTPAPGCLLWGSIVFVLTIVQNAAEEYSKICQTLIRIVDCLPRIEIYIGIFSDSTSIQECVYDFYCSLLRFWTKACKSYYRRYLWKKIFHKA